MSTFNTIYKNQTSDSKKEAFRKEEIELIKRGELEMEVIQNKKRVHKANSDFELSVVTEGKSVTEALIEVEVAERKLAFSEKALKMLFPK